MTIRDYQCAVIVGFERVAINWGTLLEYVMQVSGEEELKECASDRDSVMGES